VGSRDGLPRLLWHFSTTTLSFPICSTPKLVSFLASPEWNFEHRHRQLEAGRI
jgi:hypothetical protein